MAVLPKQHPTKPRRYTITINSNENELALPSKSYCDTLDDAIKCIEEMYGHDIDAFFSEFDYRFSIYDNYNKVIVTTSGRVLKRAEKCDDFPSSVLYVILCEYMSDYENPNFE